MYIYPWMSTHTQHDVLESLIVCVYVCILVFYFLFTIFIIFHQQNILFIINIYISSDGVKFSGCLSVSVHVLMFISAVSE